MAATQRDMWRSCGGGPDGRHQALRRRGSQAALIAVPCEGGTEEEESGHVSHYGLAIMGLTRRTVPLLFIQKF
jgi:hypothetical protein